MNSKALAARADALFSKIVTIDGVCIRCGSGDYVQCAHGFSRRYRGTRWDLLNGFPLCRSCHMYFTWRPIEWDDWLHDRWGDDLYREMRAKAVSTEKVDVKAILERLKEYHATVA